MMPSRPMMTFKTQMTESCKKTGAVGKKEDDQVHSTRDTGCEMLLADTVDVHASSTTFVLDIM